MTTQPKKRGRPKSKQTLEKEATEAWLKNPPPHIKRMTPEEKKLWDEDAAHSEKVRKSLVANYSPLTPYSLVYELESLGDESMFGHEQDILDRYEKYKNKEMHGKINGAAETSSQADANAEKLWAKNQALVQRIEKGSLSLHGAAKSIFNDWSNKGIEGEKPTVKTISNWYKRTRPN
jgi:hypothetical protein